MSDEGKAGIATALWCIAFNAGILIAAEEKDIGLVIAISATVVFLVYLIEETKAERIKRASDKRLDGYKEDCARREKEARESNDMGNTDTDR